MQTQASVAPSAPPDRPTTDPIDERDGGTRVAADAIVADAPTSRAAPATPLFTRHMRGAIEAERDIRRHDPKRRAAAAARGRIDVRPHPRLSAALEARRHEIERQRGDLAAPVGEGAVPVAVPVPVPAGV